MIKLILPLPPSSNHMYDRRGTRTFLSPSVRYFRDEVLVAWLQAPRHRTITGPVRLKVVLTPPDRRKFDVDNRLKPLLDALELAGVYEDDSQVNDCWVTKTEPRAPGGCVVEITDIERER